MKKTLKEILLERLPKKYHKKVNSVIDEYDNFEDTYYFRISLLIILACIFIMLLVISRVLIGG